VSAVRTSAGASIRRIGNLLAAGRRTLTRQPARVTTLEAATLGRTRRLTGSPCRSGTVRAHLCLPGDCRVYRFPDGERACSSPGGTVTTPPPRGYGGSVPRRPQADYWAGQPTPPVMGLGLEAIQGMTNAMNAIANLVIRNSGRSGRNAGWPYFDGTFRDYPAFKRKFESFQMNYHRGTPTR
jgi:hypothetical protein